MQRSLRRMPTLLVLLAVAKMQTVRSAGFVCLFGVAIAAGSCRSDIEPDQVGTLTRVSPTNVSTLDAWALFDRSVTIGYTPDERVVGVEFGRNEQIAAIKVRGASPYSIEVRARGGSSIGFDTVDLSALPAGWHTVVAKNVASTSYVELRFHARAAAVQIPELELWAIDAERREPQPVADLAGDGGASASATEPSQLIDPGACTTFRVELTRSPTLFRRSYLTYEATGLFRPFAMERSINGGAPTGGSWIDTRADVSQAFVEEIATTDLVRGNNAVRLCLPVPATHPVTIDALRIVGELDRGHRLAAKATINDHVDAAAAVDGRAETTVAVAEGDRMVLDLERLVAPDAVITDTGSSIAGIECIGKDHTSSPIAFEDAGDALRLQGGASACAALVLRFRTAATIAELDVVGSGAAERIDWPRIVVTSPPEHFGTSAWVGGFVARPERMTGAVRVDVAEHPSDSLAGAFGAMVQRSGDLKAAWTVDVAARFPDGGRETTKVLLADDRASELAGADMATATSSDPDAARFGALGTMAIGKASLIAATKIRLGTHAGLDIPAGAVAQPTKIQARRLGNPSLPPLDPGMINVTAPNGQGYEYLPHGQRFAKNVDVIVPFDPRLIPDGMSADDVHTYFYDEKAARWRKLQRSSIDLGEHVLHSATDHFTIMINAVLAVPTSPTPLSFDPTALTSIPAASPAAGIDLIQPPSPNATGDARLALPIRLPAGRGAYTPGLSIAYSSAAENGWLGVGWDLSISKIEIDTRWGVPTYADNEEPRYLLDGAELVPTLEVEGPSCMGGRRYHARTEGAFAHILRCGTNPSNYYWIVTDRDGTRFMYGRDSSGVIGNASLASYRARPCGPSCGKGIYRWYLSEVVDTYSNETSFKYQVDNVVGTEPAREIYPQKIEYTSHPSKPAAYSVELILDDGARSDRLINARSGFKMMTRNLLRTIRVKFQNTIIRDYVLTYTHGQFQKTVLASARMYGVGGCAASMDAFALPTCSGEFQEHTFEYHKDPEAFGTVVNWCAESDGQNCAATHTSSLTKGKTKTWSGSVSLGLEIEDVANVTGSASYSWGDRAERVGMYDVNGDGRVDQVYFDGSTGNRVRVLYNTGHSFAVTAPSTVQGLDELGLDANNSWSVDATAGIKVTGFGASASGGYSNSTSRAKQVITDLDGDGYVDFLVADGTSLRSRPVPAGQAFEPIAYDTIKQIDPTNDSLLKEYADEIDERAIAGAPTLQWVAPYSGKVHVFASLHIEGELSTDGATIALYHDDQRLGRWAFEKVDDNVQIDETLEIRAGEALYLYAATGKDRKWDRKVVDEVRIPADSITVEYERLCTDASCGHTVEYQFGREPTGELISLFDSHEMRVIGSQPYRVPYSGQLVVQGIVNKQRSSAPLRYCLQQFSAKVEKTDWPCNDPASPATNVSGTISLDQDLVQSSSERWFVSAYDGDQLVLRVEADYSFDPLAISFDEDNQEPRLKYLEACLLDEQGGCSTTDDSDELADLPLQHKTFGFFVAPVPRPLDGAPPLTFEVPKVGTYVLYPFPNPLGIGVPVTVAYRTNFKGTLKSPAPFQCTTSCAPQPNVIQLSPGESLSIEITSDELKHNIRGVTVPIGLGGTLYQAPVIFRPKRAEQLKTPTPFVGGYRGWHAAFWNEHETFAPASLLTKYEDLYTLPGCAAPPSKPTNIEVCAAAVDEVARTAIRPLPAFDGSVLTGGERAWVAPSSTAFIRQRANSIHPGSIGGLGASGGLVGGDVASTTGGLFDRDYVRLSGTKSYYAGAGIQGSDKLPLLSGPIGGGLSATVTRSKTRTTTDVVDMTGDGVPDVIAGHSVFQGKIGGGTAPPLGFAFQTIRDRSGTDYSVGTSMNASVTVTTPSGRRRMEWAQGSDSDVGVGTSRGLSVGRSQTTDDLVDINGDGLPDLVQRRGKNINVRYNLGDDFGAWETIGILAPELANASIDSFQSFEEVTDVLGDVLDSSNNALTHDTTLTQHETFSIDLWFFKAWRTTRKTSSRTARQFADLNGDGLPDLLLKQAGEPIKVQYNTGANFAPASLWGTPDWYMGSQPLELSPQFHAQFDPLLRAGAYVITGPDVLAATGSQESKTYGGGVSVQIYGPLTAGVNLSRSVDEDTFDLGLLDVTGDGHPDHVLRRKQGSDANRYYVKPNLVTGQANLLVQVKRPLGGTVKVGYTDVGNTADMPQRRQVLARIEVDDGVDLGPNFESPNLVTTFTYEDGYYDRFEKQFLGFSKVITRRADGGTIEQHYANRSFTLQGHLTRELRKDSTAAVLHEQQYAYQIYDVMGPLGVVSADPRCVAAMPELLKRVPNNEACTPKLPAITQELETRGENGTTSTKARTIQAISRDRFGNVRESRDYGDSAIPTDDVYASAVYGNDTTRWILGRPTSLVLRAGGPQGPMLRESTATYYGEGKIQYANVNTGTEIATTTLAYDAHGNLERLTTPPNRKSEQQTYTVTYDPTAAIYPRSVVDGFGYTSTADYDLRFGVATTETDVNGSQIVRTLDGFGRLATVRGAYDSISSPAILMQYFPKEPRPRAVTVTRASAPPDYSGPLPAPVTTVTIVDGFAQPLELRSTAVVDGVPGMTTSGLAQRDDLGRVRKTWQPFFTPGASSGFTTPIATLATSTDYDVLDRPTVITHPDGATESTYYAIAQAPNGATLFRTQHVIPVPSLDRIREEYTDQLGRVRAYVEHPTATSSSVTTYDYAATGELRSIVDAEGNQTTIGYDRRGLRTSLSNPDTGLIEEQYDLMGNRVALIEPNHRALGTQVTFVYDRNRLQAIEYPSKPSVNYEYGAPGAPNARGGRLTRVSDETGSIEYFYGALGETRRTLRTFEPSGTTQPLQFDHRFTSDSLGRQLRLRYPDGESITNVYDAAGMLAEVKGEGDGWQRTYATGIRYDVFGNRTRMEVGKVVTTWSYDPARVRLNSVVSTLQGPSSSKIQDLHYTYDSAGNPTSISNTLAALGTGAGAMPGASSLTLTYDGVDRLTHVIGQAQLDATKTTSYDQGFDYTPSHSLKLKGRTHLVLDGGSTTAPPATNFNFTYQYSTRPHLPDQVGDLQIQYDASANPKVRLNTTSGLRQDLVWDDDNRLVQLTDTNGVAQYNLYDATGVRVRRKTVSAGTMRTTIFASPYFDLEGEQPAGEGGIKHIFAGNVRIATVLGHFESGSDPAPLATPGAAYFVHGDHLGSTSVVTDEDGSVHQSLEYFADGETWIDRAPTTPVNGYLFNGKPFDAETGFYDYGQRFYDPRTSLWLGIDPALTDDAGKSVGRPLYLAVSGFSGNNPAAYRDPDGRDFFWIHNNTIDYVAEPALRQDGNDFHAFAGVLGEREGAARILARLDSQMGNGPKYDWPLESGYGPLEQIPVLGRVVRASNAVWEAGEEHIEGKTPRPVDLKSVDPTSIGGPGVPGGLANKSNRPAAGETKQTGSYTNTHASGKTYSGKGSRARSQQSGRRQARANDDPHTATDWTPAENNREAFKQESRRIDAQGGVDSPSNYNKVESPGKRLRVEDGEL